MNFEVKALREYRYTPSSKYTIATNLTNLYETIHKACPKNSLYSDTVHTNGVHGFYRPISCGGARPSSG